MLKIVRDKVTKCINNKDKIKEICVNSNGILYFFGIKYPTYTPIMYYVLYYIILVSFFNLTFIILSSIIFLILPII